MLRRLLPALLVLGLATSASAARAPLDCQGPAPDAQPGTLAWYARDLGNMLCAEERHLDKARHPAVILAGPASNPVADAYRDPARHSGVRFRYTPATIAGLDAEVYRPCAAGTCAGMPADLETFEPPYPAVLILHGGLSRKELHWWSSQPLAEAGYLVVAFKSAGTSPTADEADAVLDWLLDPTKWGRTFSARR